jgi:hypothetical protein
MTLRLRCIRCGEWDEMVAGDDACGLCLLCWALRPRDPSSWRRRCWLRWQKNQERHPTYRALSAAFDALQSVPPGTLAKAGDV